MASLAFWFSCAAVLLPWHVHPPPPLEIAKHQVLLPTQARVKHPEVGVTISFTRVSKRATIDGRANVVFWSEHNLSMVNVNVEPLHYRLKALHNLSTSGYRGFIPRDADVFTARLLANAFHLHARWCHEKT